MIPTTLKELAFYAIIFSVGGVLFLVGQLALGHREGGRRAVLLGCASGSGFLGSILIRHFWENFRSNQYPEALPFYFGCAFAAFATVLLGVSVFGSDRKVREYFEGVLRGL
jgi:hypothetical protein